MTFHFPVSRRVATAALLLAAGAVYAQGYPTRTVEWVVPYPPGGGTDIVARVLAQQIGEDLGQSFAVINKPGAATNIGAEYVARAKNDGYVLMSADTATLAANPFLYSKLSYSAEKDFAPVGLTVRFPMLLVVNPNLPVKNLAEFKDWVKKQNAGASYGTPGSGSPHHLATALFGKLTDLNLVHVPYRGAAPAVQDVVGGQVPFMFVDTAGGQQFVASGKLRAIGVASPKRLDAFKDVPTLDEQGLKGFEAYAWQGLVMPAGTPDDVIKKVNQSLLKVIAKPDVKARFETLGLESTPSSPADMATYAAAERVKWGAVIKEAGIKVD